MKQFITTIALASTLAVPAMAQPKAEAPAAHPAAAVAPAADMAEGEVRKVDRDAKKLTLRHGEIKSLDMPPMTMVFQVKEPALLDKLKAGDKVRFVAEKSATGFVVTDVRPAP